MLLWLAPKGLVLPTVPTRTTQIRMALLDKVDAPVVVEPAAVALNELLRNSASGGVEVRSRESLGAQSRATGDAPIVNCAPLRQSVVTGYPQKLTPPRPAPPQDYCGSDAAHFFEESAGCEIDMLLCDTDEDDLLCDSVAARDELVPPTARRGVVTVHSLFEVDRFAPFA